MLRKVWTEPAGGVVMPSKLRSMVGKCAPQFVAGEQHDAQEFLDFLLSGLHEDLNSVRGRYRENPDCYSRDEEYRVARTVWNNHLRRNQSLVVDLFHGLVRSSLTCEEYDHTSTSFEAGPSCMLPLPPLPLLPETPLTGKTPCRGHYEWRLILQSN